MSQRWKQERIFEDFKLDKHYRLPDSFFNFNIYLFDKTFCLGDWFIAFNLFISIPFVTAAIVSLKNIDHPNIESVHTILIFIFSILWLPSLALPLVYEFVGLLISLLLLGLGIWGVFKVKNPLEKLNYVNKIGAFFLLFNTIFVIGYLYEK